MIRMVRQDGLTFNNGVNMYKIQGMSADGIVETIDTTDDENDAIYLVSEYTMSFGSNWNIWYE